jgi:hypothetical protein
MIDPADLPLRDIHLPPPVGWWPPAPGWWLLALALVLLGVGLWLLLRWFRRGRLRRAARAALQQLFAEYRGHGDDRRLLRELSVLLRRIALSRFPRRRVARLSGAPWLAFLDQPLDGSRLAEGFSRGPGRVLAEGPYAPAAELDAAALERLCRTWLRRLPKGPTT